MKNSVNPSQEQPAAPSRNTAQGDGVGRPLPAQEECGCALRCEGCIDVDHHWMPESDDEINEGEPFMQCKHCNAVREMDDDEEWD